MSEYDSWRLYSEFRAKILTDRPEFERKTVTRALRLACRSGDFLSSKEGHKITVGDVLPGLKNLDANLRARSKYWTYPGSGQKSIDMLRKIIEEYKLLD